MSEITILSIAAAVNVIVWTAFFRWVTKPERDRSRREKHLRQAE